LDSWFEYNHEDLDPHTLLEDCFLVVHRCKVFYIVVTSGTIPIQTAHASIVGNYAAGYNAGKSAGVAAARSGASLDVSCPVDYFSNISYCTGYHVGYGAYNAIRP
jgi:hypothetical protein